MNNFYPKLKQRNLFFKSASSFVKLGLVVISFFLFNFSANATHIIGGETNYKCLGGGQYEVTVRVYRDCYYGAENAPLDTVAFVDIYSEGIKLLDLELTLNPDDTLTPILANECLIVPKDICVHTTQYVDTVNLPFRAEGYDIVYKRCCRNETLSNIVEPLETGATYAAHISKFAQEECNNGAEFHNWPPLFICLGEPLDWDHGATDVDGDSLFFELVLPYKGATKGNPFPENPTPPPYGKVVFEQDYSLNNLLGYGVNGTNNGMALSIDQSNGFMTAVPQMEGQFLVAVLVSEYRNGALINQVYRDFQYNIGNCETISADIAHRDTICGDLEFTFENGSNNATFFEWNIDGTIYSDENPTHIFDEYGDYSATLIAQPNTQCADTSSLSFNLKPSTLNPGFNYIVFKCDAGVLITTKNLSYDNEASIVESEWYFEQSGNIDTFYTNEVSYLANSETEPITVTLTIESYGGCREVVTKTFKPDDVIIGGLQNTLYTCPGETLELNPDGFHNVNLSYTWDPATGLDDIHASNPVVTPTSSEVYTAQVEDLVSGCTGSFQIAVVINEPAADIIEPNQTICEESITLHGTSTQAVSYKWSKDADFATILSTESTYEAFPTGETTYYLEVVDQAGCVSVDEVVLSSNIACTNPDFGFDIISCGDSIILKFKDLTECPLGDETTRSWDFGIFGTSTLDNPILVLKDVNNLMVNAVLTLVNQDGCALSVSKEFNLDGYLFDIPSLDDAVINKCTVDAVNLNPDGEESYLYLWSPSGGLSPSATMSNPLANPTETTVYSVIVTDTVHNCQVTKEVTVEVEDDLLNANFNYSFSDCTDNATISLSHDALASDADVATYNWTTDNGDTFTDESIQLVIPSGTSVEVTLEVTSANGCTHAVSKTITPGQIEIDNIEDGFMCKGTSFILNENGNTTYKYIWSKGGEEFSQATSPIVYPDATTTYQVEIYDAASGCSNIKDVTVEVPTEDLVADFDFDFTQCGSPAELVLTDATQYLLNDHDYSFTVNSQTFPSNSPVNISFITDTEVTASIIVTAANGCTSTIEKKIQICTFDPKLSDVTFCADSDVELNPNGDETLEYTWAPAQFFNDIHAVNPTVSPLSNQTFTVLVKKPGCDCEETFTVQAAQEEEIAVTIKAPVESTNPHEVIYSATDDLIANPDIVSFRWEFILNGETVIKKNGAVVVLDELDEITAVSAQLFITTVNGCEFSSPPPVGPECFIDLNDLEHDPCPNTEIELYPTADSGYNYEWFGPGIDGSNSSLPNPVISVESEDQIYEVRVTNADETCDTLLKVNVNIKDAGEVELIGDAIACSGDGFAELNITNAVGNVDIEWTKNGQKIENETGEIITFNTDESFTLSATVEDDGCLLEINSIEVEAYFVGDYINTDDKSKTILLGEDIDLDIATSNGYTIHWDAEDPAILDYLDDLNSWSPNAKPTINGEFVYNVTVTSPDGKCDEVFQYLLIVEISECEPPYIFLPNAFTPNGDGVNEVLYVKGEPIEEVELYIYNRWGQLMFETKDKNIGWDGTFNGEKLAPDAYGYILKVKCFNGKTYDAKGNVNLIR